MEKIKRPRRSRLVFTAAFAGMVAAGVGANLAPDGPESSPSVGLAVYSDCSEHSNSVELDKNIVVEAAHNKAKDKITEIMSSEQTKICRAVGSFASTLLFDYYNYQIDGQIDEGRKFSVKSEAFGNSGQSKVTLTDSRMFGAEVVSLTAEASKSPNSKNAWDLGELNKVTFSYSANFGSIENKDGLWSTLSCGFNDKGWPESGFG